MPQTRCFLGQPILAWLFLILLAPPVAPKVLWAIASVVVGVNHHQLDWVCVLGSVMHCVSFPASLVTFAAVTVTLSFV